MKKIKKQAKRTTKREIELVWRKIEEKPKVISNWNKYFELISQRYMNSEDLSNMKKILDRAFNAKILVPVKGFNEVIMVLINVEHSRLKDFPVNIIKNNIIELSKLHKNKEQLLKKMEANLILKNSSKEKIAEVLSLIKKQRKFEFKQDEKVIKEVNPIEKCIDACLQENDLKGCIDKTETFWEVAKKAGDDQNIDDFASKCFKISQKLFKLDAINESKGQMLMIKLVNWALEIKPKVGSYKKLLDKINNKLNIPNDDIIEVSSEVIEETLVKENDDRPCETTQEINTRVIALSNQRYSLEEINNYFGEIAPRFKLLIERGYDSLRLENQTKYAKTRDIKFSVLDTIQSILHHHSETVKDIRNIEKLIDIFSEIENFILEEVEETEAIDRSKLLKHFLRLKTLLLSKKNIGLANEFKDRFTVDIDISSSIDASIKDVEKKNVIDELYEKRRKRDIEAYIGTIHGYIDNDDRKFIKMLGVVPEKITVNTLKKRTAVEMKYLDFSIREMMIPHFIKIESFAGILIDEDDYIMNSFINRYVKKKEEYTDELEFILKVGKVCEDENKKEIFDISILFFRAIRNFLMHGGLNIFELQWKGKSKQIKWEEEFYEGLHTDDREFFKKKSPVLFHMSFVKNILSETAINEEKLFGLALIILYMSMNDSSFYKIASTIDDCINKYLNKTGLGDKSKLYEVIGLKEDWLKHVNK